MYLKALREYVEAKAGLISIGLGLLAIPLALGAGRGLLWSLAIFAVVWLVGALMQSSVHAWRYSGPRARFVMIGLNVFMFVDLSYAVVTYLPKRGLEAFAEDFGIVGSGLAVAMIAFVLEVWVPRWAKSRKECPQCLTMTKVAASACSCGYQWSQEAKTSVS